MSTHDKTFETPVYEQQARAFGHRLQGPTP